MRRLRLALSRIGAGPVIVCALIAAGIGFAFRGSLDLFFAQDDFRGLAAAAGVHPRHADLWRYVSVQSFMDLFHPLFGTAPRPYHVVSLLLHAANASLLYILLARRLHPAAALVGASFFAFHPAHFTALFWLSARADLLAATFGLFALGLGLASRADRWLAWPMFALGLLSKEILLLFPIAMVAVRAWRRETAPARHVRALFDAPTLAMCATSIAFALYLSVPRDTGIRIGFDSAAAYGLDFGAGLVRNLLTYAAWAVDITLIRPGLRFVDAVDPARLTFGLVVLVAALLACAVPALRRRGWAVGFAVMLLLLAPVLPLENHVYRYYLYVPLLGAGLCVAALTDAALAELRVSRPSAPRAAAWLAACAIAAVLLWNGERLIQQMATRPSPVYPGLWGDPIVDRAHIAERAIASLHHADLPRGTTLGFIMRERLALMARIARGSSESPPPDEPVYPELNVRDALLGGLAVRAFIPEVDSVTFIMPDRDPGFDFRYAVHAPDGTVEVLDGAALDSLILSDWPYRW